jgi:catechol 2,3-dioxygenase-like lactoylglutathione lyase family enzyme
MAVRRIVACAGGQELIASRDFYVDVLGMQIAMEDPVLDLQSPDNPTAEVIIGAREMQGPKPSFGVDVGEPASVDAAHAEVVRRGLRVVYPLTDEPWGVRRFFVEDPGEHDRQRARAHRLTSTTKRLRQRPASRTTPLATHASC